MCRYLDLPKLFYTVGFDERRDSLIARIACFGKSEILKNYMAHQHQSSAHFWKFGDSIQNNNYYYITSLLPEELLQNNEKIENDIWRQDIGHIFQQDSTAIALIAHRMMTALYECLLGIQRTDKKTNVNFSHVQPGLFGRPKG